MPISQTFDPVATEKQIYANARHRQQMWSAGYMQCTALLPPSPHLYGDRSYCTGYIEGAMQIYGVNTESDPVSAYLQCFIKVHKLTQR